MFQYTDPGGTLKPAAALKNYRLDLHGQYTSSAKRARSAFTLLEAFEGLAASKKRNAAVDWLAFPRSAQATNVQIDADRFNLQDEYVEWRVESTGGQVTKITFTTDFLAYYAALARVSAAALTAAIKAVIPGANPTATDLFGGAAPAGEEARTRRFIARAQQNPWINGQKGILCLAHGSNTLGALFGLVDAAAVPMTNIQPGAICSALGNNCVPSRNSDPSIAAAVQTLARNGNSLSLVDPVGIVIKTLAGIWRVGNNEVDINNAATNGGIWKITRSGRRAELKVSPTLRLDDAPIVSGAQVAALLSVQSVVVSAADTALPDWARVGQESSSRLAEIAGG